MAGLDLSVVGTYFAPGNANSEIAAYDSASQRVFYTSAETNQLGIVNISNPAAPSEVALIDLAPYGGGPNSVAVSGGIVAVAIEANDKTDPGSVVFFNSNGTFLKSVTVGALPDMLTFTKDGQKILVANEGEPNSYNQPDSVDPEGSVSIIDISNGVGSAIVTTVGFAGFNGQKNALIASGVRIFGPNATVAQDLEPEYITISPDGTTAYVSLQENNALATIDIATASVTSIKALGFKDHSQAGTTVESFTFPDLPLLGTVNGEPIPLGGFSGLTFEGYAPNGDLKFITHTDRGPNGEPVGIERPFLIPDFAPEIVRFTLNQASGAISLTQRLPLSKPDGTPLTGLPNISISANANQAYNDEAPVDANFVPLGTFDPLGADLEGIVVDPSDGTFWMVDEYRPAIYHFGADGKMIDRFIPEGTHAAAGVAYTPGTFGVYGTEALPAVLAQRRQNRGFEAVAFQNGKVYAMVQSPLRNPASSTNGALNVRQTVRLVEFDPATKATRQFLYQMDNTSTGATRADKIGDMAALATGGFLVVERDDDLVPSSPVSDIEKKIYRFDLGGATPITPANDILYSGKTLDEMSLAELATAGIVPLAKTLHTDLAKAGYNAVSKVEGLTIIDAGTLAVINDNDFQVGAANEPIILGIIRTNGLDASDRDVPGSSNNGILNIRNWPVLGMYQPDAIASFEVGGETYIVTANEGDAREYDGFAEEARVGSLTLDAAAFADQGFPDVSSGAAGLRNNDNLGRLTVTTTLGNTDGDAEYEQLYSFGGRSFSIWNSAGELVYDSGDDFEQITAAAFPNFFNASNEDNNFDSRSDNKGPEPEAAMVAEIGGRTYAFIGLERIGGIMVYDVTNPQYPTFVEYVNNRDFSQAATTAATTDLGLEDLKFIPADESPTGTPLVMAVNEISGSITFFAVNLTSGARVTAEGVLEIIGTPGNDQVLISRHGNQLSVTASFLSPATSQFPLAGIESIHAILGAGNDVAIVDKQVKLPLVLEGWSGNDLLTAGGGDATILGGIGNDTLTATWAAAILVGGDGADLLIGGRGRNVLIGGAGFDLLLAGGNQDILIGGSTSYDTELESLSALRDSWNGPGSFAARKQALQNGIATPHGKVKLAPGKTVLDDKSVDLLLGGSGQDWALKFFGDFGF